MTKESVELAIGKALLDEEFRNLLFAKPEQALAGFDLKPAEKSRLLRVDSETLEFLAQTLNRLNPPAKNPVSNKRKKS